MRTFLAAFFLVALTMQFCVAFSFSPIRQRAVKSSVLKGNFRNPLKSNRAPRFSVDAVANAATVASQPGVFRRIASIASQLWRNSAGGVVAAGVALASFLLLYIRHILWKPSRSYDREKNTVGREYDAWTTEGILEYYWGEHVHLGYYNEADRKKGYKKKNFIGAKYDFVDEMVRFGRVKEKPLKVLDVGCGIGGTSRYLAKKFGNGTEVVGITLSPQQQARATQLAEQQNVPNAKFEVMDALNMSYPDNSFDLVWACESGEHMPDKQRYVEEMTRVLKPGGRIVIATWCQRDDTDKPFTPKERKMLDFLYSEWTHPYFISIKDYAKLMWGTKKLANVETDDWTVPTLPSWRHSIWVGVYDPWIVLGKPHLWWKCFRDGITIERMHRSFESGLMEYGMMTATKVAP